MVKFN